MPLLAGLRRTSLVPGRPPAAQNLPPSASCASSHPARLASRWFENCGNPNCRSGWLHLLRSRIAPVFDGAWNCSPECTHARVATAIRAELSDRIDSPARHRHRIPFGLVMLEQGWISKLQLRQAIEAQRTAGGGRLGQWLVRQRAVDERLVTRALGLQWCCPVFAMDFHDAEALATLVPRLFLDAFGALPLRLGGERILYLGFEERLDPALALAIERMVGLRVESGVVEGAQFHAAHARMLGVSFPRVELIEAGAESAAIQVFARAIEKHRPLESRLVRVHDCLWLRLWKHRQNGPIPQLNQIQDVLCSIGGR